MSRSSTLLVGACLQVVVLAPATPVEAQAATGRVEGRVLAKRKKFVKNTIVYLDGAPGKFDPPQEHAVLDQKGQTFVPFVLPIVVGTTVDFLNSDESGHNVFSPDGETYDLGMWPRGEFRSHRFEQEGVYTQLCKLHSSMIAFVVVLSNPFFSVTRDDGSFEIEGVPPGDYVLRVWAERREASPVPVRIGTDAPTRIEVRLLRK